MSTSSLEELFVLHASRVYGYAAKRCGDPALAEDLTAIAFESASRRFADGMGHEVTLPWLFTVVRRRLIDHWRKETRRANRWKQLRSEAESIRRLNESDDHSAVSRALAALSTRQRAALVLRYLDDMSVSEVGEELGISYKATESLLSRARKSFSLAYWETE